MAGIGGIGAGLIGCSDPPEQDILQGSTEPTRIQAGGTVSGSVFGLLTGRPASNATIEFVEAVTVVADFAGNFSLRLPESGDFIVRVSASDFLTRQTAVRLQSNATVSIGLIETDQKLTTEFLNQFARGQGPRVGGVSPRTPGNTNRWLQSPKILLYRRLDGDPDAVLSDRRVEQITGVVNNTFFGLTGGVFGFAPAIETVDAAPPADRTKVPLGAVGIFQTTDGSRGAGHTGAIRNRWAIANAHAFSGVDATIGVLTRVFGQSLGPTPVEDAMPSVLNAEGRSTLTPEDTQAAIVLYNRPPGNQHPDTDPEGFFLNA